MRARSTEPPAPVVTARARATRARVLAAARQCIDERGPLGATSNEIARRAGVSWGVIQYHFGTREGILLAMIEDGFASLLGTLDGYWVSEPGGVTDPIGLVVEAIWHYCTRPEYLLYTDVLRLLARDPGSQDIVERVLRETEAQLSLRMARLLQGTIDSAPMLRTVRSLIFATMRGLALRQSFGVGADTGASERELLVRSLHLVVAEERNAAAAHRRRLRPGRGQAPQAG